METSRVISQSLLSDFELFGVSGVLGGQHFLKSGQTFYLEEREVS